MQILGIIPARYASTRFPGKPLVDIAGKSMIQRVYEQASKSKALSKVVVATDDERIFNHVKDFGGAVVMTSATHQSGTDRCAEVIAQENSPWEIAINIQGDEPFIHPEQIDAVAGCFTDPTVQIATLIKEITTTDELLNINSPKVIFNHRKQAIYFSRTPIPFNRNAAAGEWLKNHTYYKHIGIYAYRTAVLKELTKLPVSALEKAEALEQLRWIENGYVINVEITQFESTAVDIPEDLLKLPL